MDSPKVSGPIAAIIVSVILTIGLLLATGSLMPKKNTYATVNFDGGYKKIGVISQEEIYTKATVSFNGRTLKVGDFYEIIDWITEEARETGGVEKSSWRPGVSIKAEAGISWIGSESRFKLQTENFSLTSTEAVPTKNTDVISRLKSLEQQAKTSRAENVKKSLEFGPAPTESFLLSKVLSALSN